MSLTFTINGDICKVRPSDYPADITLNTFIREHVKLFGTKFYCLEGGCGVCIVTIRGKHPLTNEEHCWGANSCLTLLNICDGWDIVTIEGLGNKTSGYHPIQKRLAHFNGTQCGYCSPGMIMNMYSNLMASNGKMTMEQIEHSFGGNICRCTGYRPILDAMKSFASNSEYDQSFSDMCGDIEDLQVCPKNGKSCMEHCRQNLKDSREWHHPRTLEEIFDILHSIGSKPYMLVAGNTGHGVYRRSPSIEVFINVNYVKELHEYVSGGVFELGANMTLTEVEKVLQNASAQHGFEYFEDIVKHLSLVAHVSVKNMGTLGGNLSMKHQHNEFISDIFLLLTTVLARIFIAESSSQIVEMSVPEFLKCDMERKVIVKITLPRLDKNEFLFGSYKILPRSQNAHAYINAGFLFHMAGANIISSRICYGGINPNFIESTTTVNYLQGRHLYSPETISQALHLLELELEPDWILPDPSPEYRRKLAVGLFYKFILQNTPPELVKSQNISGGSLLSRPLSSGIQTFDTNKNRWPVNQPVRKLEAMWQCSGEANYANDIPYMGREVWAAFVHATSVHSIVSEIDPHDALSIPGVVAFYSAKDIPGSNTFTTIGLFLISEEEEVFCSNTVKYHSQPVGIVLAETFDLASFAATKVKILYEHTSEKEIFPTLKDKFESRNQGLKDDRNCAPSSVEDGVSWSQLEGNKRLEGHLEMRGQFHFSLETHTTIAIPRENGLLLYPSSHNHDHLQVSVANALNIKEHLIDIEIRRLGGSFGCKISRSNHVGVACSIGSWLSNRPVRFVQTIESNMATTGKRFGCICYYATEVNDCGKVLSMTINFYEDMGCSLNESPVQVFAIPAISNCYDSKMWSIHGNEELTDASSNTWFRAPGTLEGIAIIENIMEHVARVVGMDPVDVRQNNIPDDSPMKKMLPDFVKLTEYRERRKEIEKFNLENRWKKRGIGISTMNYIIDYVGNISATVAIYHYDGSVAITHGGVECGQGLNTKAAQVVAYTLGIPLDMVSVKATNAFTGANAVPTGSSITSETVCYALQKACQVLLDRLKSVRETLKNPTWVDVVRKAYEQNVNLFANDIHKAGDMQGYSVWGLTCSEIEVDILTGNYQLKRVDILEDTGESLSPLIDVGQIEGAFVMGLGYWLTERLVYDRRTGELMTNRTWNYKVPGAKDIPIDFRITLLQKNPNTTGFLRSKTTGEMAICMSISAVFALRHALDSARKDAHIAEQWYHMGAPTTIEEILLVAGHEIREFQL